MSAIPEKIDAALTRLAMTEDMAYYSGVGNVFKFRPWPNPGENDIARVRLVPGDWVYLEYAEPAVEKYSTEQWMFILAHEAGHLILEHLGTTKDQPHLWYTSCEAAINERVKESKEKSLPDMELIETCIFADKLNADLGSKITPQMTDEEIYEELLRTAAEQNWPVVGCGGVETEGDGSAEGAGGKGKEEASEDVINATKNRIKQAVAEGVEAVGGTADSARKSWGSEVLGLPRDQQDGDAFMVPWETLLQQAIAMRVRDERMVGYSRKLGHIDGVGSGNTKGRAPLVSWREIPDPEITCYIDLSGSIDNETASKFYNTMRRYDKARYYTFDHDIYETTDREFRGGGGTDFDQLETHPTYGASNLGSQYPDVVVVLTDGYANTPTVSHPERWIWLLTPGGSEEAVKDVGQVIQLT